MDKVNWHGKGSDSRVSNKKAFNDNWDRIFGVKKQRDDAKLQLAYNLAVSEAAWLSATATEPSYDSLKVGDKIKPALNANIILKAVDTVRHQNHDEMSTDFHNALAEVERVAREMGATD